MRPAGHATLFLLLLLALAPAPAEAGERHHTCKGFVDTLPAVITTPGTWCLRKNLATSMTGGVAIEIATNNVTLDCNGFKINGLAGGLGTSASAIRGQARINTTVHDCGVRGFWWAILFTNGSDGTVVEDSVVENATERGIVVQGDRALIRRNRIVDVGGATAGSNITACGISLDGEGELLDNSIAGVERAHALGIHVQDGVGTVIAGNRIRDLVGDGYGAYGIQIGGSNPVIVRDNAIVGPGTAGIDCYSAAHLAMHNTISGFGNGIAGGCSVLDNLVYNP
jgi:hypothetical protein